MNVYETFKGTKSTLVLKSMGSRVTRSSKQRAPVDTQNSVKLSLKIDVKNKSLSKKGEKTKQNKKQIAQNIFMGKNVKRNWFLGAIPNKSNKTKIHQAVLFGLLYSNNTI